LYNIPIEHVLNNNCYVGITKYREPAYPLLHKHDFYEIEYVIQGIGKHIIDGNEFSVSPGDIYFTNFNTKHCFQSIKKEDPVIVYNCVFHPRFFDNIKIDTNSCTSNSYTRFISEEIMKKPFIRLHDNNDTISILNTMYNEIAAKSQNYDEIINGLFIELLHSVNDLYNMSKNSKTDNNNKGLYLAKQYIDEHYKEQLLTEKLAKIAFLSPTYFCSCFKKCFGTSVTQYIQEKRLLEARRLLEETDDSIKNISFFVGYDSEAFFRNIFKKKYGSSPSDYRKHI
jgi:AraC-like DNA-binding protein/quercetin dioxygenase-like cupin family protein